MLLYRVYGLLSYFFLGVALTQLVGSIVRLYPRLLPVVLILVVLAFLLSQMIPKAEKFILVGLIACLMGGLMAWL